MPLEHWVAGAVMVALTLYALGAGADFGGGVWDLLSSGPRAREQRELIAHAIGPIWEANHVWLILVVVLLFVCFPAGWAAISIGLHVPLSVMLLGIVLRGSAFTFRSYDDQSDAVQRRWGRIFAVASVLTPLMLGTCVGAVASGAIQVRGGQPVGGFFHPWLAPFPLAVGVMALVLFAFLAAVYLTLESGETALREDFRRRALGAGVLLGLLAFGALALAREGAPRVWEGLSGRPWSLPLHAGIATAAMGALASLWWHSFPLARVLAVIQVMLVVWGWGLGQFPYLLPPDLTFTDAAAPASVLRAVLGALVVGGVVLAPSLWALYRVFKGSAATRALPPH
jgi:cytochrome d ubiquinol oxidase subunit II